MTPGPITLWIAGRMYRRSQGEKVSHVPEVLAVVVFAVALLAFGVLCAMQGIEDRASQTDCPRAHARISEGT